MSQKSSAPPARVPAEKLVRDIRRATRKHHSAEDKIRIVLEGLRSEETMSQILRDVRFHGSLSYATSLIWRRWHVDGGAASCSAVRKFCNRDLQWP